ncbi:hypothetical protein HB852_06540 [Listeria grandensis]|uniref:hypothetical protein n=1 Tax=Listeria grandensis TaxID=1494963 RepID=UPI0017A1DC88|nr:hypothetical protein [Listeria grandensis]MBC1474269.1 hypothetical protein [Listeria grandensis]
MKQETWNTSKNFDARAIGMFDGRTTDTKSKLLFIGFLSGKHLIEDMITLIFNKPIP